MKLRYLLVWGLVAVAAGCGDDDGGTSSLLPDTPVADSVLSDTPSAGDADTGDEDGDAAPDDTGPVLDAQADVQADVAEPDASADAVDDVEGGLPADLEGSVLLSELDSAFSVAGATARFTVPQPEAPAEGTFGPCVVRADDPASPAPAGYGWDAGVITAPGTTPPVTLTPVDEGDLGTGYQSSLPDDQEDLLPSGGVLVVSGAGGTEVGPFEATAAAPEPVTVSSPAVGGFGASAATDADLAVAWNAGSGEEILVTLSPLSGAYQPEAGYGMVCTLAEDSGSFTIPQGALEMVRDGAGTQNTALGVTRIRFGHADADGVPVTVRVTRSSGGLLQLTD